MTGLGICQIRPTSPSGAVSWAMAKPWVGCSLISTSTVHSASDSDGPAFMNPSVLGTYGVARDLSARPAPPFLPTSRVTDPGPLGSFIATSYALRRRAGHAAPGPEAKEITPMARFLITYYAGEMPQDPESIAQARRAFA